MLVLEIVYVLCMICSTLVEYFLDKNKDKKENEKLGNFCKEFE